MDDIFSDDFLLITGDTDKNPKATKQKQIFQEAKLRSATTKMVDSLDKTIAFLQSAIENPDVKVGDKINAAKALLSGVANLRSIYYDVKEREAKMKRAQYEAIVAEKDAYIASRELAVERGDLSQGPRPTEEIDFDFEGK